MGESYVGLPADQPSGKKLRTRQRTIGANLVDEQFAIMVESDRVLSARFFGHAGALTVQASADTPPAGRWFLFNPTGSSIVVAVRRIAFRSQHGSVLATATSPRIAIKRFTATGTASGAAITPGVYDTTQAAQVAKFVSANTGLTITDGAFVTAFLPVVALTAVGAAPPSEADWPDDVAYPLLLRAGEGIYCAQPDAGTTSDSRRYLCDVTFDEVTFP